MVGRREEEAVDTICAFCRTERASSSTFPLAVSVNLPVTEKRISEVAATGTHSSRVAVLPEAMARKITPRGGATLIR
jgi:hypothetical protein